MQCALGTKNNLGYINGTIHVLDLQDLNRNAWERCNHLVQSWIINYASDSIAQTIVLYDSAFMFWQDLHERFSKIDRIHNATLYSSFNNLKQGTKSVLDYH